MAEPDPKPKLKKPRLGGKAFTAELRKMLHQVHEYDDDGAVSKVEKLARIVWDRALGYEERIKDPDGGGDETIVVHKPDKAFIELLTNRLEGPVSNVQVADEGGKITARDHVAQATKTRMQLMAAQADASTTPDPPPMPPMPDA